MKHMNIGEMMTNRAYLTPDMEGYVGGKRYTFKHMNQRVNQFAAYLTNRNIKKGERIALLCKNNEDFITVFFAAAKLGIITVPINWRLQAKEVKYIIEDCEPTLIIHDEVFTSLIEEIGQSISIDLLEVGNHSLDEVINGFPSNGPIIETADDEQILMVYTSGTTGKPKGAIITHTNLLAASIGMSNVIDWWSGDRFLSVAPFFHIGGFAPIITNLHTGSTSILVEDFDPVQAWRIIEEEKVTTMMTVPVMLQYMLKVLGKLNYKYDSLRNITCGASLVPVDLIESYDEIGIKVQQVYGITEYTGAVSFWKESMGKDKIDSMGKVVFHGDIKIINPNTNEELPANEIGEIMCSGPQVFKGYWKNKVETNAVFYEGNYLTGDLGKIDSDGFLYVIDRLKDMIISGGENIYSTEVEAVFDDHPDIVEVAVIGKPDQKWGEVTKAFIVKKENSGLTKEEAMQLCRDHLAPYKCVKEIDFIDELPRNASGKILKNILKK